jgi:biotin operon repressor/DNA-binding transcriptional regulator YhcF (GntR family)
MPADLKQRVLEELSKDSSRTWRKLAQDLNVSYSSLVKCIFDLRSSGCLIPLKYRKFTEAEDTLLRQGYQNHISMQDLSLSLGRSEGVLRQRICHYHRDLILSKTRSRSVTVAGKKFGLESLRAINPDLRQAAETIQRALKDITDKSKIAAKDARQMRIRRELTLGDEAIAAGKPRNQVIFDLRALGITLEQIGKHHKISRERVRQLCEKEAIRRALLEVGAGHGTTTVQSMGGGASESYEQPSEGLGSADESSQSTACE